MKWVHPHTTKWLAAVVVKKGKGWSAPRVLCRVATLSIVTLAAVNITL